MLGIYICWEQQILRMTRTFVKYPRYLGYFYFTEWGNGVVYYFMTYFVIFVGRASVQRKYIKNLLFDGVYASDKYFLSKLFEIRRSRDGIRFSKPWARDKVLLDHKNSSKKTREAVTRFPLLPEEIRETEIEKEENLESSNSVFRRCYCFWKEWIQSTMN